MVASGAVPIVLGVVSCKLFNRGVRAYFMRNRLVVA